MDRDVAIGLVEMLEAIKGTLDSILEVLTPADDTTPDDDT